MSDDPYKVLGVPKTATQAEIKKAYRALAKKLHPDLHPDDPGKQAEFQAVSAAYDLLGDAGKRKRFDAGEIDASGQERPDRRFYQDYANQEAGRRYDQWQGTGGYGGDYGGGYGGGYEDASDLFSDLFGRRYHQGHGQYGDQYSARGADVHYHLSIDFLDAVRGSKRGVTLPDGKAIELAIPAGVRDGQSLRLRGKGRPGLGQGPAGDALVTIGVKPHPVFRRDGDDIELDLPVTFDEAVLGAKVEVPTISGTVSMTIPKGASSGRRLRLKGKGVAPAGRAPGDQVVRLQIVLPETLDAELEEIAERWRDRARQDPRKGLRSST